jgi:hypothetical protein
VRFQVLTAASMVFRIVFWDVLYQGSLMMEAVRTSETSVDSYFTRQYIPEDNSEHNNFMCELHWTDKENRSLMSVIILGWIWLAADEKVRLFFSGEKCQDNSKWMVVCVTPAVPQCSRHLSTWLMTSWSNSRGCKLLRGHLTFLDKNFDSDEQVKHTCLMNPRRRDQKYGTQI